MVNHEEFHGDNQNDAQAEAGERYEEAGSRFGAEDGALQAINSLPLKLVLGIDASRPLERAASCISGLPMDAIASEPAPARRPKTVAVAHAWLLDVTYRHLVAEAERRRVHVDALAAEIITAALLTKTVDKLIFEAEKLLDR